REARLDSEGAPEKRIRGDEKGTWHGYIPAPAGWKLEDSALHGVRGTLPLAGGAWRLAGCLVVLPDARWLTISLLKNGHLHISRDSCRVPVQAPLSVGRFVRFVLRHFYPGAWQAHKFLREWNCPDLASVISVGQQQELYLACSEGTKT